MLARLVLCLSAAVVLGACGARDDAESPTTTAPATTATTVPAPDLNAVAGTIAAEGAGCDDATPMPASDLDRIDPGGLATAGITCTLFNGATLTLLSFDGDAIVDDFVVDGVAATCARLEGLEQVPYVLGERVIGLVGLEGDTAQPAGDAISTELVASALRAEFFIAPCPS